eukprot:m51a1_g11519 putative amidohydrolase 2 (165) ;mRNA; f:1727-6356
MQTNRIDVHHHIVPPFYREELLAAGDNFSGWRVPTWSPEAALSTMESVGISKAYLSVSTPGALIYSDPSRSRDLARRLNVYSAGLVAAHPSRFGFFASLPSLLDLEGTLQEITYSHDVLGAAGFLVFTSYGDSHTYLGTEAFEKVWAKLDEIHAVLDSQVTLFS